MKDRFICKKVNGFQNNYCYQPKSHQKQPKKSTIFNSKKPIFFLLNYIQLK